MQFPSPLELPCPIALEEKPRIQETLWCEKGKDSRYTQAWDISFEFTETANLYLANGEAFLLSADEWIAGQDRARKALA